MSDHWCRPGTLVDTIAPIRTSDRVLKSLQIFCLSAPYCPSQFYLIPPSPPPSQLTQDQRSTVSSATLSFSASVSARRGLPQWSNPVLIVQVNRSNDPCVIKTCTLTPSVESLFNVQLYSNDPRLERKKGYGSMLSYEMEEEHWGAPSMSSPSVYCCYLTLRGLHPLHSMWGRSEKKENKKEFVNQ